MDKVHTCTKLKYIKGFYFDLHYKSSMVNFILPARNLCLFEFGSQQEHVHLHDT